jgi:hypothetical protein
MMRRCPRCDLQFDPALSRGLCPACGRSGGLAGPAIVVGGLVAGAAVILGVFLIANPFGGPGPSEPPPDAATERFPTEFPAAGARILPPADWRYNQRDESSIAFTHMTGGSAVRFRVLETFHGDAAAHLELVRQYVPNAAASEGPIPAWPGAAAIALRAEGDGRLGASWLVPWRGRTLHVLFWGEAGRIGDMALFREGLKATE